MKGSLPWALVSGPDGNLWWIDYYGYVGEMTTAGTIKRFERLSHGTYAIANGPDGKIYILESRCNANQDFVAQVTTGGQISEYMAPSQYCNLALAAGPDKQVWIVGDVLQKFNPVTHTFSSPIMFPGEFGYDVYSIAEGSDKEMWMSQPFKYNRILLLE